MKRRVLIQLGGVAAMLGGTLYAALGLMMWLCIPNCPESLMYIISPFFFLMVLGALAAIAALHILQRERYGLLGTLAFLVAFVGVAMLFVDALRNVIVWLQGDTVAGGLVGVPWLFLIGLLLATVGIIAYGAVTIGTRILPWWCGLALIAGSSLVGFFLYLFSPVEDLLLGVPWAVVGYAIFRARAQQSSRVM